MGCGKYNRCKVSVIIPVYNAKEYIKDTLDSILSQTLEDIEIICVDDLSTDGSDIILEQYSHIDNRIRVLYQKQNSSGAALARNLGISQARGEFLSILDADDLFDNDMLEHCYKKASEDQSDVVVYGSAYYSTDTKEVILDSRMSGYNSFPEENPFSPRDYSDYLFQKFRGAAWTAFYRREYIVGNNIMFYPAHTDDIEFTYIALACANKISTIKRRFVYYRRDAIGNQTSNLHKYPKTGVVAFAHFKKTMEEKGVYECYKKTFANLMLMMLFDSYLCNVKTEREFDILFYELKKELKKIGAYDIEENEYLDRKLVDRRDSIVFKTPKDYFIKTNAIKDIPYDNSFFHIPFQQYRNGGMNIVLYGAGKIGKRVFEQLFEEEDIHIVSWVDKNYKEIGFPLESLDVALNKEYDLIYIAIENHSICEEIKGELLSKGVSEKKIHYCKF